MTRHGSLRSGRFFTSIVYWLLWQSFILRESGFDWPRVSSEPSLEFTAAIVRAAAEAFAEKTGGGRLHLLVYPRSRWGADVGRRAGVEVLDYSEAFDPADTAYIIEGDGHPSARAANELAHRLAEDLAESPALRRE